MASESAQLTTFLCFNEEEKNFSLSPFTFIKMRRKRNKIFLEAFFFWPASTDSFRPLRNYELAMK